MKVENAPDSEFISNFYTNAEFEAQGTFLTVFLAQSTFSLVANTDYDVEVRAVNDNGGLAAWTTGSINTNTPSGRRLLGHMNSTLASGKKLQQVGPDNSYTVDGNLRSATACNFVAGQCCNFVLTAVCAQGTSSDPAIQECCSAEATPVPSYLPTPVPSSVPTFSPTASPTLYCPTTPISVCNVVENVISVSWMDSDLYGGSYDDIEDGSYGSYGSYGSDLYFEVSLYCEYSGNAQDNVPTYCRGNTCFKRVQRKIVSGTDAYNQEFLPVGYSDNCETEVIAKKSNCADTESDYQTCATYLDCPEVPDVSCSLSVDKDDSAASSLKVDFIAPTTGNDAHVENWDITAFGTVAGPQICELADGTDITCSTYIPTHGLEGCDETIEEACDLGENGGASAFNTDLGTEDTHLWSVCSSECQSLLGISNDVVGVVV